MSRAIRLKLFVLHYSVVDAHAFFLARNERDLFERFQDNLIDERTFENILSRMPSERRGRNGAADSAMRAFARKVIATGSIHATWHFDNGEKYSGEITWESYSVSHTEIALLRRLGLIQEKADVGAALEAMRRQIEVRG